LDTGQQSKLSSNTPPAHWLEDEEENDNAENSEAMGAGQEETTPLREQLSILKGREEDTKSAVISWERQSARTFFSPDHAVAEFERKIKDHWGMPRRVYWLCINEQHESQMKEWPEESSVVIKIKGLGAGPVRYRFAVRFEGKRMKASGPMIQTLEETAKKMKIPTQGMRVCCKDRIFPLSATLEDVLREDDNATFDIEKGGCYEFKLKLHFGKWYGCGSGSQTFNEVLRDGEHYLKGGCAVRSNGDSARLNQRMDRFDPTWEGRSAHVGTAGRPLGR
jgi:hypothetical protein